MVAVKRGDALPGQDQRHRAITGFNRDPPGDGRLVRIAWANDDQLRHRAQRGKLFDRLMRWTVLSERNAVVRENIDHPQLHQRRQPNRWPHIVRENEKRRGERNDATMRRQPIRDGSHAMLAHTEVQVASAITPAAARRSLQVAGLVAGILEISHRS